MKLAFRVIVVACAVLALNSATRGAQQVYETGKGVTTPTVVKQVKADYTDEAKAAGIQGSVLLRCVVLADGKVGDVTVDRSLDADFGLDRQAVAAMKQWQFKPGMKDGKAVAVRVHIEMTFTLR